MDHLGFNIIFSNLGPPEDFDHNRVHKPAVMIGNTHGDQILDLLKRNSPEYNRPIITSIHWNVPRPVKCHFLPQLEKVIYDVILTG